MEHRWQLLAVPLLIALNAFFVAAEYAIVAARPTHIEQLRQMRRKRTAAAMEALKTNAASSIGAVQVCITMTNLLLGWLGEPAMNALLQRALGPLVEMYPRLFAGVSLVLSFLIVTLLTVVFSELLPKALTLQFVIPAATVTAAPMLMIRTAITPLVALMNGLANLITRPLGLGRVQEFEQERITADEIRTMTAQATDEGTLTPSEQSMILNALSIGKRRARQIMVPRVKVAALDLQRSMDENRAVLNERLHSHLPLADGGLDHLVGVVPTKEFLAAYNEAGDSSVLSLLAHAPVFVPETAGLDQVLAAFQESGAQLMFVVDEYGGIEGIVTLRDVLDELLAPQPGGA